MLSKKKVSDSVVWHAKYNPNFTLVTLNDFPEMIQDTQYCETCNLSSCTSAFQDTNASFIQLLKDSLILDWYSARSGQREVISSSDS